MLSVLMGTVPKQNGYPRVWHILVISLHDRFRAGSRAADSRIDDVVEGLARTTRG